MSRIWTVARRELKALFDHPTGYVLLVVFLALTGFLFFRQAYLTGVASLRPMLDLLPWVFLFFVPAVTMRALAEDIRGGQIETVLAQPLTELELLLGKYLGAVLFLWLALALTLFIPLGLSLGASDLRWGVIAAQYAGAALLAAGLAGVGVWASSLTRSQITAFIVGVAVMFLLVLVGLDPLLVGLPPAAAAVAARLGVLSHFQTIGRGVIDLRDAVYFLSLAGVFLALAYGALLGRKLAPATSARRRMRLGVALLVAALVVVTLLGNAIGGRLDLTPGKLYTLAPATRQIVGGLDDLVTIKLFASEELPTDAALLKRDVDDLLRDLRAAGRGKVRVIERDPAGDPAAQRDAQALGVVPVQFNVIGRSELQIKEGFLGLAVQHGDGTETIPVIEGSDDLEYRVVSAIRALNRDKKPVVTLVTAGGAPGTTYNEVAEQLGKTYDVRRTDLLDTAATAREVAAVVVLGTPDSLFGNEPERLERYLARGGSAFVAASGMKLSERAPVADPRQVAWNKALARLGATIRTDMAYDLMANEIVPIPTDFGRVMQPYPLFIRAQPARNALVTRGINDITLTWASSIDTAGAKGRAVPLLLTSPGGGAFTNRVSTDPTNTYPREGLGRRLLAVSVGGAAGGGPGAGAADSERGDSARADSAAVRGRAVVVGSADFLADRFVRAAPDNLTFALNAVDWLAEDEALIAIRSKDRRPPQLLFVSPATRAAVQYGNVVGVPALVAVAGLLRLLARRRRTRETYQPLAGAPASAAERAA
jgi:ABC-type uncharacterized transport system involved in gliding motility auxiliary subunit